jgi:hypothetical protein
MRSKKLKQELAQLEQALVAEIKKIGVNKAVEILVLKQPDISAWLHGERKWSWDKVLKISEKLGL